MCVLPLVAIVPLILPPRNAKASIIVDRAANAVHSLKVDCGLILGQDLIVLV